MISYDDVEALILRSSSPGIRPGLDRIERLLSLLENPQGAYPGIHVVGTNGKGSTCAMLASVFSESGYRTALYTSPHLESPGERLTVDRRQLPPERWMAASEKAVAVLKSDQVLKEDPPSYFELTTAVAFLLAAEEKAEVAVIEAGLGGRLDATNLLSNVVCSVVTSLSMDHSEYLGDTLEKIAGEKFAVIRSGTPTCYLGDNESLVPLYEMFCERAGATSFVVSRDAKVENASIAESGGSFDFSVPRLNMKGLHVGLLGRYQIANASLALSVLSLLLERFPRLTEGAIRKGLDEARWPGRLEIVAENPMIVLDGGHNPDGVTKVVESVSTLWSGKKIGVVYCAMRDKDYPLCLEILNRMNCSFYATGVPGMERSLKPRELAEVAGRLLWLNEPRGYDDPLAAIRTASEENEIVLVCGSFYLIGFVRPKLRDGN